MTRERSPTDSEEMEKILALTRKLLEGIGIEDKQIETIIEAHSDTVTALKKEIAQYKDDAERVPLLQKQLEEALAADHTDELQSKLDEAVKAKETAEAALAEANKSFDDFKAEVQAEKDATAKAGAYRKQVLEAAGIGADYLDDVMAVAKLNDIELDDDGNIKGASELAEAAKGKWKSFVVQKETKGAQVDTPPANKGGIEGANPRAIQIARERHERMYGKQQSEE